MTKIKICGMMRKEDIEAVNEALPDYIGFILHFEKSRRNVSVDAAREMRSLLRREILPVGVFVDQPVEVIEQAARTISLSVIQLHGREDEDTIRAVKDATGLPVWKAFRVQSPEDLERAAQSPADEVLLDNGYGTGHLFDWSLTTGFTRPFMLAGGLTPENIPDAIERLRPRLVDLSSGVETDGAKDPEKILAAVRAVRAAR
ncbi:MAG: phosphoribosylanthranilate isomerase [Clostridia bacterium]|nr:phosphoribosylanthranilate isomerase [Clostridia bacterium]